jgi:transposase
MAKPLIADDLWAVIEPLLPPERPRPKGGRVPLPHRGALTGILFVLKSGIPWEMLPQEMGCGSGMTCWPAARLAGCRHLAPAAPCLARPPGPGKRHRLEPCLRGQRVCSRQKGGEETGPNPTDRGRAGSKRHLITDAQGHY